ncbi:MAG: hypothetical protein WC289_05920 [Patescibacteria group bacterium]
MFGALGVFAVAVVVFLATLAYIIRHRHDEQSILHHNAGMVMGLSFVFSSLAAIGVFCWFHLLLSALLIANIVVLLGLLVHRDFKMEYE